MPERCWLESPFWMKTDCSCCTKLNRQTIARVSVTTRRGSSSPPASNYIVCHFLWNHRTEFPRRLWQHSKCHRFVRLANPTQGGIRNCCRQFHSKPLPGGFERNGEWLLKKSFARNLQKQNCARMPYKQLSRFSRHFVSPKF